MFESLGLEVWHIWLIAASVIAVIEFRASFAISSSVRS